METSGPGSPQVCIAGPVQYKLPGAAVPVGGCGRAAWREQNTRNNYTGTW